jgi:hypothetical protein
MLEPEIVFGFEALFPALVVGVEAVCGLEVGRVAVAGLNHRRRMV